MNKISEKPLILIVDDMPANLKILEGAFKDDYVVKHASNGMEALNMATTLPLPDLILLDIMMPGMDGFQVLKILKTYPETREVPVIFVTALNNEADEEKGLMLGAIDYVTEPYSVPVLKARVRNHIELKKMQDVIKENSMLDGLTQIANKKRFNEVLESEWSRARRYQEPVSILMLDLDYFKKYNDTYGHLKGDEALIAVATALKDMLKRGSDLVARWGGEEFACILPNTNEEGALVLAEELRQGIENLKIPHQASGLSPWMTVSVGAATMVPGPGDKFLDLVHAADQALYQAKEVGRNQTKGTQHSV